MKKDNKNIRMLAYIFILFAVILSLAIILMQVLYFEKRAQKVALSNGLSKMIERESVLKSYLDTVDTTLVSLRESIFFQNYLNNPNEIEGIEELFIDFAKSNKEFMQVRYIDALGMEKIRIQRNQFGEEAEICPESELQDKSQRYYFIDSKTKPLEQSWFTTLDLNVEEGEIQNPYVPTLRAIFPLENKDGFDGILIINYFAQPLIDELTNTPLYDMILCDNSGFVIYHYDYKEGNHDKCWGNSLESQYNISKEFPVIDEQILENPVLEKDNMVSRHFDVPLENGLVMILQLRQSYLIEEENRTVREYSTIFIIVFLFSIVLTYLIIKIFGRVFLNLDKVKQLNESLKMASEIAKIGFFEFKPKNQEIYWYKGIEEVFEEATTDKVMSFSQFLLYIPEEDKGIFLKELQHSIDNRVELFVSHRLKSKDGGIKYVEERVKHGYDHNGNHIKSVGSIYDISSLKEIQKELEDNKLRWQFAVEGNKDGLWDWQLENDEIYFSDQCFIMLGYFKDEVKITLENWRNFVHPEDKDSMTKDIQAYINGTTDVYSSEYRLLCKDGTYLWVRDRGLVIEKNKDGSPKRLIGTITDITEYVEILKKLKAQSYIDVLTQLENRKAYIEKLSGLLEQFKRYGITFSIALLDIDFFKTINDTYGHSAGDIVLRQLGKLLKNNVRENDDVFRIGGEEFIIIAIGIEKESAVAFAEKIRKIIAKELKSEIVGNREITVSIGVTDVQIGDTIDTIFSRADKYLYAAKDKGRNKVVSDPK